MQPLVYLVALMPSMIFMYWGALAWGEIQKLDARELFGSRNEAATAAKSLVLVGMAGCLITIGSWLGNS